MTEYAKILKANPKGVNQYTQGRGSGAQRVDADSHTKPDSAARSWAVDRAKRINASIDTHGAKIADFAAGKMTPKKSPHAGDQSFTTKRRSDAEYVHEKATALAKDKTSGLTVSSIYSDPHKQGNWMVQIQHNGEKPAKKEDELSLVSATRQASVQNLFMSL